MNCSRQDSDVSRLMWRLRFAWSRAFPVFPRSFRCGCHGVLTHKECRENPFKIFEPNTFSFSFTRLLVLMEHTTHWKQWKDASIVANKDKNGGEQEVG